MPEVGATGTRADHSARDAEDEDQGTEQLTKKAVGKCPAVEPPKRKQPIGPLGPGGH